MKSVGKIVTKKDNLVVSESDCLPRKGFFSTRHISDNTLTLSLVYFSISKVRIYTKTMLFLTVFYSD